MNDENKIEIPDYVKKLPPEAQDFIFSSIWEDRTKEVARKYSLNESQTESLINTVALVLIGVENPDDLYTDLLEDLKTSKLLTEQIISELEKRVFEFGVKIILDNKKPESDIKEKPDTTIPELKPNLLPETEKVASSFKPISIPKEEVASGITYPAKNEETVQQPLKVPEVNIASEKVETKPITPPTIVETKLKAVTPSISETPSSDAPKKYTVDPYREPIN